ncbi:hypothetical protein IFVP203_C1190010 [Vibrio parahaemolyticus]
MRITLKQIVMQFYSGRPQPPQTWRPLEPEGPVKRPFSKVLPDGPEKKPSFAITSLVDKIWVTISSCSDSESLLNQLSNVVLLDIYVSLFTGVLPHNWQLPLEKIYGDAEHTEHTTLLSLG